MSGWIHGLGKTITSVKTIPPCIDDKACFYLLQISFYTYVFGIACELVNTSSVLEYLFY
jgi:hypothetical protein